MDMVQWTNIIRKSNSLHMLLLSAGFDLKGRIDPSALKFFNIVFNYYLMRNMQTLQEKS